MGYAVLHMEKTSGTDAAMSAHIERTIRPKNADADRTHLNRELISFPDGIVNRTQAIQHRLDTAGLIRKIGSNQVRAIRILLTGTHEDMERITNDGRLEEWCGDNLRYLADTFGKENIVSAVLHMDEQTPHIHATLVPIVRGERKRRKREEQAKKRYRKKPTDGARLCADDIMTRQKLKEYQDSYAQAMARYGLQRGIDASTARHISTRQYYREVKLLTEELKADIVDLQERKETAQEELRRAKREIQTEKLKGAATTAAANIAESVGSLFGSNSTAGKWSGKKPNTRKKCQGLHALPKNCAHGFRWRKKSCAWKNCAALSGSMNGRLPRSSAASRWNMGVNSIQRNTGGSSPQRGLISK